MLNRPSAGPDDSFFALGGDSIRSIRLVRAARRRGLALSTEDVFVHPTPAGLATRLGGPSAPRSPVPPPRPPPARAAPRHGVPRPPGRAAAHPAPGRAAFRRAR
ncbi:phosphopantetheine-binding protein [Streptomyces albus]|nr:phosphopantetheine-binding protein [Streptomyces albus]